MRPKRDNLLKKSLRCRLWALPCFAVSGWLAGMFFLMLLSPIAVSAEDGQPEDDYTQHGEEGVSRHDKGFPIPRKGPLISELREDLSPDIEGPETVIRLYEDAMGNTVREFLINGALFQIEVTPANGPTYYLIDVSGNGLFEERHQSHQPRLLVPQWVFYRF